MMVLQQEQLIYAAHSMFMPQWDARPRRRGLCCGHLRS